MPSPAPFFGFLGVASSLVFSDQSVKPDASTAPQNVPNKSTTEMLSIIICQFVVGKDAIVISPHVAGHLLGGSVWKITKDGDDAIYAMDYNFTTIEKKVFFFGIVHVMENNVMLIRFSRTTKLRTDAHWSKNVALLEEMDQVMDQGWN